MAKTSFAKLNLKVDTSVSEIHYPISDTETATIEIKRYLPIDEKIDLVTNVLVYSQDDNNFANPMKIEVYKVIEIVEKYTNLNITEKQKENPQKLYDTIVSSGLWNNIYNKIYGNEMNDINYYINTTIENYYKQKNSALGIIESIGKDYSNLDLEASEIQKKLADPNNMAFLKDVLTKLG